MFSIGNINKCVPIFDIFIIPINNISKQQMLVFFLFISTINRSSATDFMLF